jgi:VWFA-related protein
MDRRVSFATRPLSVVLPAVLFGLLRSLAPALPMGPAPAQSQPPEEGGVASFDESVSVSWVLVSVVVRSRHGHVEGLGREDFRVWVDGRPAAVDGVDLGEELPLAVVYLQDLSGSIANSGKLEASRRALSELLQRSREGDQVALATFAGERLRIEVPFTGERNALEESMGLWEAYGTTALHDAVSLLPDISQQGRSGRRVAVLVTDGLDNASALDPEEAVAIVRGASLPVYVLGLTAGRPARTETARAERYADLLAGLAERSGGRYFEVAGAEEAGQAVAALVDDLRRRYVLAVATAGDGAKAYHEIRVEAALPYRHTLTHRKGYYGTPPIED